MNYTKIYQKKNRNVNLFLEHLFENPNDIINSIALAIENVRENLLKILDRKQIILRFYNLSQILQLSNIKSHLINNYLCFRGTVLRVSSIKVLVESIHFSCLDCKSQI
jgi:DNA replicative helicase MCM subunit Mcm2 (Cdc46/Mcm family)